MKKNPLRRGMAYLKHSSDMIQTQYSAAASRALHLTGISSTGNLLLGLGKIISGLLSLSAFVCVNGCYTLGMVLARYCALAGVLRTKDIRTQYRYYRWSGIILIFASLAYMIYSGWSWFHPRYTVYHEYIALAIATFTFTEIGLNVRGVFVNRRNKTPLLHAIKIINLAASLITLVLTQSALLSFAGNKEHNPSVNALLGLVTGGCAALLGCYMILRIGRMEKQENKEV